MNIVFISEQLFAGTISDEFQNYRTEFVWFKMLDAFHIPYQEAFNKDSGFQSVIDTADLIVIIPSKTHPEYLQIAKVLKNKKLAIMQEGPHSLWQDWDTGHQIYYMSLIKSSVDIVFCHNEYDKKYYEGLTSKPVIVLPTAHLVEEWSAKRVNPEDKKSWLFVGGNLTRWYNGMVSYLLTRNNVLSRITFPSMGRRYDDEEHWMTKMDPRIKYLPYLQWNEFMEELNDHKFAVHLMPEVAAGSFSLNCAMLGIPCIGNVHDDTQRLCFPELSVELNDTKKVKDLMKRLFTDNKFYKDVSDYAVEAAKKHFDYRVVKEKLMKEINEVLK